MITWESVMFLNWPLGSAPSALSWNGPHGPEISILLLLNPVSSDSKKKITIVYVSLSIKHPRC